MSYSLVEIEISNVADALVRARFSHADDPATVALEYALSGMLGAMEVGMKQHVEECQGIVQALADARAKLEIK